MALDAVEDNMWKGKRPEEERDAPVTRKGETITSSIEEKTMEPRAESKPMTSKENVINIGRSVFIKGELTGDEDLTIEGRVEGKIELRDHNLVIGADGKINAEINAKNVTIVGSVVGNISASEIVEIKASGNVVGDIRSARIAIADGARFKGNVDMHTDTAIIRHIDGSRAETN